MTCNVWCVQKRFFGSSIISSQQEQKQKRQQTTLALEPVHGVAGVTAIISANFFCYIVDLQYMWSEEHNRYEHEA